MTNTRRFPKTLARAIREQLGVQLRVEPTSLAYLTHVGERACKGCGYHECSCPKARSFMGYEALPPLDLSKVDRFIMTAVEPAPDQLAQAFDRMAKDVNRSIEHTFFGLGPSNKCAQPGCKICNKHVAPPPPREVPRVGDVWRHTPQDLSLSPPRDYRLVRKDGYWFGVQVAPAEPSAREHVIHLRMSGFERHQSSWTLVSRAEPAKPERYTGIDYGEKVDRSYLMTLERGADGVLRVTDTEPAPAAEPDPDMAGALRTYGSGL